MDQPWASLQTDVPIQHQSLHAENRSMVELVGQLDRGDLTLDAPYQRGHVWTGNQRRLLIRSILQGVPIPAVIVNDRSLWPADDDAPLCAVIDGKQRIEAVRRFVQNELDVPASWFEPDRVESTIETADGPYVRYGDLSVVGRRFFANRATIPVARGRFATVREEAEIYLLVNGAGTDQSADDLLNAQRVADD
ncbi:DUF262 domain-containing protein [Nostocoides jenkinsii]|nr:DUF262 domain-containing protein [Tetrasphaera jenkinsii]